MGQIDLLTKEETAELLAVSETTVERLIAAGHLPAYRIGRAITRIDRADVVFLAQVPEDAKFPLLKMCYDDRKDVMSKAQLQDIML